jgi:hypothetical protein
MAIHLDQKNVAAYFNRGDAYVKTGSIELAVSDFSKGCSLGDMNSCDALQEVSRLRGIGQRK